MVVARLSDAAKAQCYALRNPPKGGQKMKYADICKLVKKLDNTRPSVSAVREVVETFKDKKNTPGRPKGWRKTTKEEDKVILKAFHKVRPPGHGVDSRKIRNALPKKIKRKVSRRTVIRRLADKGYKPMVKIAKLDQTPANKKKRLFQEACKPHLRFPSQQNCK